MAAPVAMRITLALLLCSASAFARLGPGAIIANSSTPTPTASPSPTGNCVADCTLTAPTFLQWGWIQTTPTTTITAATIVYLINTNGNFTRTLTSFNDLPAGVTMPSTNKDGTVTCDITLTRDGSRTVTALAYPTVFRDYQESYKWAGTLSTDGVCSSPRGDATVTFSSHPDYNAYTPTPTNAFQSSLVASVLSQEAAASASAASDPTGEGYGCAQMGLSDTFDIFDFLDGAFPSESAFHSCDIVAAAPETVLQGVAFVTATVTSIEGPLTTDQSSSSGDIGTEATPSCNLLNSFCTHSLSPAAVRTEITASSGFPSQTLLPQTTDSGPIGLFSVGGLTPSPAVSASVPQQDNMTPDLGSLIASIVNNNNNGGTGNGRGAPTPAPVTIAINPTSTITLPPSAIPQPGGTAVLGSGPSSTVLSATTNAAGQTVVIVAGPSSTQTVTLSSSLPNGAATSGMLSVAPFGPSSSTGSGIAVESAGGAAERWIGRELWSVVVMVVVMAAA